MYVFSVSVINFINVFNEVLKILIKSVNGGKILFQQ